MAHYNENTGYSKNCYSRISSSERIAMNAYCEGYKQFLNQSKTERTAIRNAVFLAEQNGFEAYRSNMTLSQGDKIYFINRGKSLILARIGSQPMQKGVNIIAAHVDAPRLDLRPCPLYEEEEMAYFRSHYYGWMRKYQWVATPLILSGVVSLKNGTLLEVSIGDRPEDPRFIISDLLPHLANEHNQKSISEGHTGEMMNILVGSEPVYSEEEGSSVKRAILNLLHQKYGICEDDFISSELEAVPAYSASDVGLDHSLIGAYGHDDKVCAYAAVRALLDTETIEKTAICVLADKEEIGNIGITSMRSAVFDHFMGQLCQSDGSSIWECYQNSFCLSADVTSAYDSNFAESFRRETTAHLNHGVAICKYTGFHGKEAASDASAEMMGYVRRIFDEYNVAWQVGEMGRIDLGGGGTVALELANRGIDTVDAGVAVLSMHSPFEVVAKADCYMLYRAGIAVYLSDNHR
ncbi:MAG: aminopeptidase [Eubacteriales bacterium]|nr:aminopeptidase [Eubacteriales bacterium]